MKRNVSARRLFALIIAVLLAIFCVGVTLYYKPPLFLAIVLSVLALVFLGLVLAFFTKLFLFNRK